jgi:ammonia channel protein AmtB
VGVGGALAIGLLCGVFCYLSVTVLKRRFGYDDSLDVFGLHGIGGMIGAVLTGVFCVPSMGGLVEGVTMGAQVVAQLKGSMPWSACVPMSRWKRWGWTWPSIMSGPTTTDPLP